MMTINKCGFFHRTLSILLMIAALCFTQQSISQETANSSQAREIFDRTFKMVFGPQGCSLRYDVNIVGVYKVNGTIWYKGKKSKFIESRYSAWNDGVTYTDVDKKKKIVEIFDANDPKRDKYASKCTFEPNDYNYKMTAEGDDYILTVDAKKGAKGVKHLKAIVDKKTGVPKSLKIKVMIFWITIKISNFKSGGVSDNLFVFPKSEFASYPVKDYRN